MRLPFPSPPTRHFGRRWLVLPGQSGFWNEHTGCDWSKNYGTPIPASDSGEVIGNYYTALKGWQLVVRHPGGRITRYHMLNKRSHRALWSQVREGEIIGYVGSSGTASTGPHLHFEVWVNGKAIDPYKYITAATSGSGAKPIDNKPEVPVIVDKKELSDMLMIHIPKGQPGNPHKDHHLFAVFGTAFWNEFVGQTVANAFSQQIGAGSAPVTKAFWDHCKRVAEAGMPRPAEIKDLSVTIDAGAIAKAVNDDAAERLKD